jgi:hypothetical protein
VTFDLLILTGATRQDIAGATTRAMGEHQMSQESTKHNVVQLPGTEIFGVEHVCAHGRNITYAELPKDAPLASGVFCRLKETEEQLVNDVVALTAMIGRIRDLQLQALDGDADAIKTAQEIAEDCYSPIDWDTCGDFDLSSMLDDLEDMIEERQAKTDVRENVPAEDVDGVVRDIVVSFREGKYAVNVHDRRQRNVHVLVTHARIVVKKLGPYVDIYIYSAKTVPVRSPEAEAQFKTGNAESDALVARVVERDGGYAIVSAIFQVAKTNVEQRIDLLRKAVAA